MSVPILSCPCGLRMKARGATPGRVGRCPRCGRSITVRADPGPDPAGPEVEDGSAPEAEVEAEPVPRGDGVRSATRPATAPIASRPGKRPARGGSEGLRPVEGARPIVVARPVGPWWRPDLGFPARGAEGLMIVAMLGLASWVLLVLIPELGLAFLDDGEKLGTPLMGKLVALIVGLPALMLAPLAITYTLQYLGRVLVSAAMGEVVPPRPPDRNFDGLFGGLGPWLVWLASGASIGLGPLAFYLLARPGDGPPSPWAVLLLAGVGLPYALMSLMMTFLDDGGIPRPAGVIGALARLGAPFLVACAVEVALGLVAWRAASAVLSLRAGSFWTYILAALPGWMLAHWLAIVAARALGVFYHRHAKVLRWHREKPWWGMT